MIWLVLLTIFVAGESYSQGYICAVGGGSENYNDWSDAPYRWIVQKSDSGAVAILSDADATSWLPDYFMWLGADTAYNVKIASVSDANNPVLCEKILQAKAVFLKGGDQWDYIRLWKGTKADTAINSVFNNGGVISGTSAGAAVLGAVDFSAKNGSVYPAEALKNPFTSLMQFDDAFLNFLPGVIFDTHFIERARHARLVAMLFNRFVTSGMKLTGVGVDDRTAICISPDGIGEVMGSGAVSIFTIDPSTKFYNGVAGKYFIEALRCDQLTAGWKYDFSSKTVIVPPSAKVFQPSATFEAPVTNLWLTGTTSLSQAVVPYFADFLLTLNSSPVAVLSHPSYINTLSPVTTKLAELNIPYTVVGLSTAALSDTSVVNSIVRAKAFIFAGDSLKVLSIIRDSLTPAGLAFRQGLQEGKPVFFFGKSGKISGSNYIDGLYIDKYAAYRGKMTNNRGIDLFPDMIFEPATFESSDYYENKMSSVLWGIMINRRRVGVVLDGNSVLRIKQEDFSAEWSGITPALYLNASQSSYIDSSVYRASGSTGTRQVIAITNLRYSVSSYPNQKYFFTSGSFGEPSSVNEGKNNIHKADFQIRSYPNPFNSTAKLFLDVKNEQEMQISVFDILGRKITEIYTGILTSGNHTFDLDTFFKKNLSSGSYYIVCRTKSQTLSHKLLYLK